MKTVNYPEIKTKSLYMRSYLRQMEPVCIPATLPCSLGFYGQWHLLHTPVLCSGETAVHVHVN